MSQLSWDVFVAPELALVDDLPPGLSTRTWGPTSATLITGREDAVLVDALLTTAQATALAGWIQASGRNLTTVYVTHGHGDHFFGLPIILDRFPKAKAVAMPGAIEVMREQTAPQVIEHYYDAILPGQIPDRLEVPGPLPAGRITLEGHALIPVELGHTDTAAITCLHVPSLGLVVAGDAVYNTTHVFTGESDARARRQWRVALDVIASLSPRAVIAGHKPPGADDNPRHIELTRRYLDDFDRLQAAASSATALYEAMLSRYLAWASPGTLWGSIGRRTWAPGSASKTSPARASGLIRTHLGAAAAIPRW
jgi:glyoxylase-like metal-dependent hydrolase (beta-lactamase superfamily II)